MNAIEIELSEDEFEDHLNEVYPDVDICGWERSQGTIWRAVDPTGFGCAWQAHECWECAICGTRWEDEEAAELCYNCENEKT